MKDKNIGNNIGTNLYLVFLALTMSIIVMTETATAKSLYVIADINVDPQPLQAYDIGVDGALAFQAEYEIPHHMCGGVGLAIDSDNGQLFVTYEASDNIQLVDTKTMAATESIEAPDASNLAGIVYDHDKELLYCVDRRRDKLYVYDWEPSTGVLSHVQGSPFILRKANAFGIALDEIDDILYVANGTEEIYAYDTSTWVLVRTITVSRIAISVAVDVRNGFLYSGGGYLGNHYLTQYHLATDAEKEIRVEPDAGVMGLGVDTDTGYIYISTGNDTIPGGDNLLVYDTSLKQIDKISGIGNPTGLVVPGKDVGYNPLNLMKQATEGVIGNSELDEIQSVGAGGLITYTVCFDNLNSDYTVTDLVVVDTLPYEVSFVEADEDQIFGRYDPVTHTYTWLYPSLLKGTIACLDLTVQVNNGVEPGMRISNSVTINSNETPPTTTGVDVYITSSPLHIKKSIVGASAGEVMTVDPGENITYRINFSNNDNDFTANGITIVDILPEELSFVSADYDLSLGHYDADAHAYIWRYPAMEPGDSTYITLVAKVNPDVVPGTTITNYVVIDCDQTAEANSSVDVITAGTVNRFNLSKTVVGGAIGEVVEVGLNKDVTYCICFDGNDIVQPIFNVSIVDILPQEVSFVKADGDGIIGHYDENAHTYTWSYDFISPGQIERLKLAVKVKEDVAPGKTITNIVTIDSEETPPATASVDIVTVEGGGQIGDLEVKGLQIYPSTIRRNGAQAYLKAVLQLPQDANIKVSDISNEPAVLSILSPESFEGNIKAETQLPVETSNGIVFIAWFDVNELMSAIPGYYGELDVSVEGKFTSDQELQGFSGITKITISRFGGN